MGNLKNVPSDILLDIVTRLPAESILDCKLVCKPWLNLVSRHPLFSKLHLTHLNRSTDSGKLSYLLDHDQLLHYFEYDEDKPIHSFKRIDIKPPFESPTLIGSINGLVCLFGYPNHTICICNPVTKEYVMLPDIKRNSNYYYHRSSGFGYLPSTNEYKVVELYDEDINSTDVVVYTLGSGSGWRNVGRFSIDTFGTCQAYGVFSNGALHWMDVGDTKVFVFDLAEEKFQEHLPLPLPVNTMYRRSSIGVLGGILYHNFGYFCQITKCFYNDIWLLKGKEDTCDMKEQEPLGWSKQFCLPGKRPLGLTKSGNVLCFNYISLSIYDVISSTSKEIVDPLHTYRVIPHKNTLVSLKELGEEDIKKMKSAKELDDPSDQLER